MRAHLSPWDLARSADGSARALEADPRSVSGGLGLVAVGGAVLTRAAAILVLAGAVVTLTGSAWGVVVVLVGAAGPVVYTWLYLRASTPVAREVMVGSLRRGYRVSVAVAVLAAAVLLRYVGVRQGWVAGSPPTAPWLAALAAVASVRAQTGLLRRRCARGR